MVSDVLVSTFEIIDGKFHRKTTNYNRIIPIQKELEAYGKREAIKLLQSKLKTVYNTVEKRIASLLSLTPISGKSRLGSISLAKISTKTIDELRGVKPKKTPKSFEATGSFNDLVKSSFVQKGLSDVSKLNITASQSLYRTREVGRINLVGFQDETLKQVKEIKQPKPDLKKEYKDDISFIQKNIKSIIESNTVLKNEIFRKASVLNVAYESKLGFRVTTFNLKAENLSPYLIYEVTDRGELIIKYSESFIKPLLETTEKSYNTLVKDILATDSISIMLQSFQILDKASTNISFVPGSIKVINAPRLYTLNQFIKETEFSFAGATDISEYTGIFKNKLTKGQFLTQFQFTELVRRLVKKRMPYAGPIKSPAMSPTVLTYRTGRFVDSIRVYADYVRKKIAYTYMLNPYQVHETTRRDPRRLIGGAIRTIAQQQFARAFLIERI